MINDYVLPIGLFFFFIKNVEQFFFLPLLASPKRYCLSLVKPRLVENMKKEKKYNKKTKYVSVYLVFRFNLKLQLQFLTY